MSGNAIEVTSVWSDREGTETTPTSATYQVFDSRTGEPLSGLEEIDIAESWFIVDGQYVDAGTSAIRRLSIQVIAEFDGGTFTTITTLAVRRRFQ